VIARTWHGRVPADKAEDYHEFLLRTGVPDYRATPGNLGVLVFRRREDRVEHFLLVSFWQSLEHIKAFAGPDPEQARYYPEDLGFLLEFVPTVTHYEVYPPPAQGAL
jgi:heme-degrading monooxygenase HmoA